MTQTRLTVFQLTSGADRAQRDAKAWQNALASGADSHVAFVAAKNVSEADLQAGAAPDADVTVIVEDAARAAGGRASADLAAVIWQSFPSIAALLSDGVSDAGAVLFSPSAFQAVRQEVNDSPDPVTAAVLAVVARGGNVRAVLMPGDSNPALPSEPSQLAPRSAPAGTAWRRTIIESFEVAKSLGGVASRPDETAVRAGLLLWHDDLDASHRQSQSIEGEGVHRAGDYWHAIMHRREKDYGNSKYWFRHVGKSPVFDPLATRVVRNSRDASEAVAKLAARIAPDGRWDPFAFVDACHESENHPDAPADLFLRRIQADEMLLLLWQTCLDAQRGA